MDAVYIRLAFYSASAIIAAVGLGTFDAAAGTLTIHLDAAASAVAGAMTANVFVYKRWGKPK